MKLFNFLTRKKEEFKPLKNKKAGIYACGPTVYNFAHIGNFRTYIFEDFLRRGLEMNGYKVKLIMNITDIDDKIIRDAKKANKTIVDFVRSYEKAFFQDIKRLNIKSAFKYPKATRHIKDMTALIQKLLQKGLAYKTEDGSIYFDISKFKKYGKLSRRENDYSSKKTVFGTGARIDADEYEKNQAEDFALWKTMKAGEPSWPAKFQLGGPTAKLGKTAKLRGRPGWHIECSAMGMKYLGQTFDIHAGGIDLLFPHHENEIAQSEGATGKPFAKYFVEGEHLMVEGQKMSKSLGNIYTLGDLEKRGFDPSAFRYFILTAHYRSKLNFTWKALESSARALQRLKDRVIFLKQTQKIKDNLKFRKEFENKIMDDLDTPAALAAFWSNFHSLSLKDFLWSDRILGLNLAALKMSKPRLQIKNLVQKREKLRKEKKWKEADEIRAKIRKLGWQIEDSPSGPIIKKI
jgi:cysteinyl-tRNA synthetase